MNRYICEPRARRSDAVKPRQHGVSRSLLISSITQRRISDCDGEGGTELPARSRMSPLCGATVMYGFSGKSRFYEWTGLVLATTRPEPAGGVTEQIQFG